MHKIDRMLNPRISHRGREGREGGREGGGEGGERGGRNRGGGKEKQILLPDANIYICTYILYSYL